MDFFELLKKTDLVLASQSPRRKDLLEMAGFPFRVWVIPSHEEFPPNMEPVEVAHFLCKQKAAPFIPQIAPNTIIITADTIVVKDNHILNKAVDAAQAREMLQMLSGTTHRVITGVCLSAQQQQQVFHETTTVKFAPLSLQEIDYYIATCQPFDKAGAYGIQEWIGAIAVESIEGSYHNVVGLPMARLYGELKNFLKTHFNSTHME